MPPSDSGGVVDSFFVWLRVIATTVEETLRAVSSSMVPTTSVVPEAVRICAAVMVPRHLKTPVPGSP